MPDFTVPAAMVVLPPYVLWAFRSKVPVPRLSSTVKLPAPDKPLAKLTVLPLMSMMAAFPSAMGEI